MIKAVKSVLFALFAFLFLADVSVAQKTSEIYAKGELLVKYKNGTASAAHFYTSDAVDGLQPSSQFYFRFFLFSF